VGADSVDEFLNFSVSNPSDVEDPAASASRRATGVRVLRLRRRLAGR
jgi:hypothetical protein